MSACVMNRYQARSTKRPKSHPTRSIASKSPLANLAPLIFDDRRPVRPPSMIEALRHQQPPRTSHHWNRLHRAADSPQHSYPSSMREVIQLFLNNPLTLLNV